MKDARTRRRSGRTQAMPPDPTQVPSGPATSTDDRPAPGDADDAATRAATAAAPGDAPPRQAPGRPGGRPRDAAREAEIVAVAIGLVAQEGLPGLTMDALALRAGASKATLYRRWPDRLSLALALLDTLAAQRAPVPETGSVDEDLSVVLRTCEAELRGAAGALLLGLASEVRRTPELAAHLHGFLEGDRDRIRGVLERGQARGELHAGFDVALVAEAVTSICLERVATGADQVTRNEAEELSRRLLRSVAGTPDRTDR